jgi:hypothetical protein
MSWPPAPSPSGWQALRDGAAIVPLPDVGGLRVVGDDRIDFLHGQLSHDVRGLAPGGARRMLLLDVKGHAHAELGVHRRERDVHLAVEDEAVGEVAAQLRGRIVFDQVEIQELAGTLATLTVQGPAAPATLARLGWRWPAPGTTAAVAFEDAELLLVAAPRSQSGGVDVHLLARHRPAVEAALRDAGAAPGDVASLEASRVAAGRPRAGREAGKGVLPQEAGLDDRVSTRKGCYLGQEVMARLEARGRVKRGLARLTLAAPPTSPDERAVTSGGRTVGRLGTVARHPELGVLALAVLRLDAPEAGELAAGGAAVASVTWPRGALEEAAEDAS